MDILITGGNGYIAKSLYQNLKDIYNVTIINRNNFDLTNREDTNKWFEGKHFNFVIHTAIKGGSRLKEDSQDITYQNISMFYNLLNNESHFKGLINLGSGAEELKQSSPYGLSKKVINDLIQNIPHFYNIKIFGVFDENELETRFIKNNINNYINKKPLNIDQNKKFDFFYMQDLIKIIKFYLKHDLQFDPPPKQINCSYLNKYTLLDIANIINNLENYKCDINISNLDMGEDYIGIYNTPQIENGNSIIKYIGLEQGIKNVYSKLKYETY